jgi:hypothetical protein
LISALLAVRLANTPGGLAHPVCFWPTALTPCRTRSSSSIWPSLAGPRAGPSPLLSASARRRRRAQRAARASPFSISGQWAQLGSPDPSPRPPRRPACARPGWARCDVHRRSAVTTRGGDVFPSRSLPSPSGGDGGGGGGGTWSPPPGNWHVGPVLMGAEVGRVPCSRYP